MLTLIWRGPMGEYWETRPTMVGLVFSVEVPRDLNTGRRYQLVEVRGGNQAVTEALLAEFGA